MRDRFATFVAAILLLPPLALSLAGREWEPPVPIAGSVWLPALLAAVATLALALLLDALTFRRKGHSLLRSQRSYLLWCGAAGAALCLLLAYLNLFAGSWLIPAAPEAAALLLAALCGAVLLPAVLVTRLWLAGLPGLVQLVTRRLALPSLPAEATAMVALLASLTGLLLGTVWIDSLGWLYWMSPLLLLVALQLLWHESTLFSGLPQGDWSRVLLSSVSGIAVVSIALAAYRLSGGALAHPADTWQLTAGLALFGMLCMQLGDIVAEQWRGKKRPAPSGKKPFPISVVTKKDH